MNRILIRCVMVVKLSCHPFVKEIRWNDSIKLHQFVSELTGFLGTLKSGWLFINYRLLLSENSKTPFLPSRENKTNLKWINATSLIALTTSWAFFFSMRVVKGPTPCHDWSSLAWSIILALGSCSGTLLQASLFTINWNKITSCAAHSSLRCR